MMDNLLNSSRLIDGDARLFFRAAAMDLAALLRDVCGHYREIAPAAQIGLHSGDGEIAILGDAKLLFLAFSNLVSNAIKYSPGDAMVDITAKQDARATTVRVRDAGLGIEPAEQELLFNRYYRGSNVAGIVGTGVGLYLTRTIVELHGGRISVERPAAGGACFVVVLPNGQEGVPF
jgi:signal transduction histidine kinase